MPDLKPYQEVSRAWLTLNRRAYLADAPRVGKTAPALVAARNLQLRSVLVICPAIARTYWREQRQVWCGMSWPTEFDVLSYDEARARPERIAIETRDLLIVDEAHYCGNADAARTRVVMGAANRARRVWLLSGTPQPRDVMNLYPPLRAVWPDLLPETARSEAGFRAYFTVSVPTDYGMMVVGLRHEDELRRILGMIMLRRTERDPGIYLPPLVWQHYPLSIAVPGHLRVTDLTVEMARAPLFPSERRQLGELKAPAAARLLEAELESGALGKVLVGAHHLSVLDTLEAYLRPYGVARIDGSTSSVRREARLAVFRDADGPRVLLAQTTALQNAIDCSAADEAVIVEPDWNPDVNYQFGKRIQNLGDGRARRVRLLLAPCDLDRAVARVNERKLRLRREVIED